MHSNKADYTNTFYNLINEKIFGNQIYSSEDFLTWKDRWKMRLSKYKNRMDKVEEKMKFSNPIIIPRNYKVEEALSAAESGDMRLVEILLKALEKPYENNSNLKEFQIPEKLNKSGYKTYCGT